MHVFNMCKRRLANKAFEQQQEMFVVIAISLQIKYGSSLKNSRSDNVDES